MTNTELIKSLVPVIPSPKMKIDAKVSRTDIVNIVHSKLVAKAEAAAELAEKESKDYNEEFDSKIPKILEKIFKRSVLAIKALGFKGDISYTEWNGYVSISLHTIEGCRQETPASIKINYKQAIKLAPELAELYKIKEEKRQAYVDANELLQRTIHNKSNINVSLAESILNSSDQGKQMLEQLDVMCNQFDDKLNNRQLKQ